MPSLRMLATVAVAFCSLAFAQEGTTSRGAPSAHAANSGSALAKAVARMRDSEAVTTLTAEGRSLYDANVYFGTCHENLLGARKLYEQGELRQAIRQASVSLFLSIESKQDTTSAFAKLVLASSYLASGDLDNAKLYAMEAKKHTIRPALRGDVMSGADKILGDVALKQGAYDTAVDLYEKSFSASLGDMRFYARAGQALALANAKRFDAAKESIKRAEGYIGVLPPADQAPARASLMRVRGMVALAEGRSADAIVLYEDALKNQGVGDNASYDRFWLLEGLARGKLAQGDKAGALKTYLDAIDLSENIRGRFRSEEVRSSLFGEMQDVFGQATQLLFDAGQFEAAWEVNERGRGRALLDMLGSRVQVADGSDRSVDASGKLVKPAELAAQLKPGETVLSYRVLDGRTYAWLTRSTGTKAVTIDVGHQDLVRRVQAYRDAIVEDAANAKSLGAALYDALVRPLALAAGESVAIIPHDALHYLPFQALWTGEQYFIQKAAISYAPSANALLRLQDKHQSTARSFFGMGNPDVGDPDRALPGAQKEVEAIKGLFKKSETYFLADATRDRFYKGAPLTRLIHIAAHGTVDPVDPLSSKLYLAKEPEHRGTMEAREIFGLKLGGTELVALSACETGLGKVSRGDEIWGFTRSFLSAGAPALLVSLWPVSDDATEILMKRFYDDLSKGKGKRQALRNAELAVLADARFASPVYWAAFNLVGDHR